MVKDEDYDKAKIEGQQARSEGLPVEACPYPPSALKLAWYAGWHDENGVGWRTEFPEVFDDKEVS